MIERAAYAQAAEVLDHLVALYPSSLNGPWNLADVNRLMGDTATAIRYYEECPLYVAFVLSMNISMSGGR